MNMYIYMHVLAYAYTYIIHEKLMKPTHLQKDKLVKTYMSRDFPGGTVVKNLPANAGDTGLSPDAGRSHMPRSN